jgi:hypothetical protein
VQGGDRIQELTILVSVVRSVADPEKKFQPMMDPTIACDVETGIPSRVIQVTVRAAASATVKAPAGAFTEPSLPSVSEAPAPLTTAPRMTKALHAMAAVRNLIMRVPTAVP